MLCSSIPFVSSQGFSKSGNPDVLKLFHRHTFFSVWMIRISVLVKVNGIRHYSFIDLILPCISHKLYCFQIHTKRQVIKQDPYSSTRLLLTFLLDILYCKKHVILCKFMFFHWTSFMQIWVGTLIACNLKNYVTVI
jgi:hypothetical protein